MTNKQWAKLIATKRTYKNATLENLIHADGDYQLALTNGNYRSLELHQIEMSIIKKYLNERLERLGVICS